MAEQIFFENGNITINQEQFIVENQTFEMASITSLKIETSPPSKRLSGNIAIVGALCFSLTEFFFIIGLLLLGVAFFLWKKAKPHYSIILNTRAGEKQALVSDDKEYIDQVVSALNQALISRN